MLAGRFSGETIFTSWRTTVCPGSVSSQLPPASPARSTITEPGFIPSTASAVTSRGAGRPGHERGRDDDVEALDRVGQRLLLAGALLLGQLARVAALAARLEAEVEPLRAERLDLLGDLGAHVVAGRARAQPLGGRERLQARHADAEHEHLGRAGSCRRRSSASGRSARAPRRPAARRGSRRRCSARRARPSTGRARSAGSPPSRTRSPWRRPARASSAGLVSGARKPIRIEPVPSAADLLGVGRRDRDDHVGSSRPRPRRAVTFAPASAKAASPSSASTPAPLCTTTSRPLALSLPTTSGTSATRCSPAAVSFGTPIRI